MSLRQALKSKFRLEKSDTDKESDALSLSVVQSPQTFQEEDLDLSHDEANDECPHPDKDCTQDSCKACYEAQLTQLQEQLVATMLENQQLSNELKQLREQTSIDQLVRQLEKEKEKTRLLSDRLHEKELAKDLPGSKSPRLRRFAWKEKQEKHALEKSKSVEVGEMVSSVIPERDEWVDVAKEVTEDDRDLHVETPTQPDVYPPGAGWRYRVWMWFHNGFYELLADFTEPAVEEEESREGEKEGDPLTVRKLKENIMRFGSATKPFVNMVDSLTSLLRWKSPGTTLLALSVYIYTVYHGWFLPLMLFLANCRLLLNYIRNKGWFIGAHVTKRQEHEEGDMGVSDKFQLVLHVARKVQNQLGHIADCCEKLKNLFMWQQPDVTAQLFLLMLTAFLTSCVFPANQLFTALGLYLGLKLFLVDYLFFRFPRVQQKYDSTARMWRSLPTDAELEKRHNRAEIDRLVLNQSGSSHGSLTTENQNFCELFNLPPTETPLPFWHAGRRCTLINRDRSFTSAFKNGRLYLTNSFLCFERSKTITPKNLVLPLKGICKVEKAKPYPWMPGGGMALEVIMDKSDKAYIFGAIMNRDEAYESIVEAGRRAGLLWASHLAVTTESEDTTPTKKPS